MYYIDIPSSIIILFNYLDPKKAVFNILICWIMFLFINSSLNTKWDLKKKNSWTPLEILIPIHSTFVILIFISLLYIFQTIPFVFSL